MKTQTIRYGQNGGVEIIDIDVSDPQAGEVQVQHAACGVCAWDLATFRDTFPPAIRFLARGHIDLRPLITHIVPLEDYPALLREATGGDGSYIKGVVKAT